MKTFALDYDGRTLEVEFDQGATFWYRARLIVDNQVVDERNVFWGTTRLRASGPRPLIVDASTGFWGPKKAVLIDGAQELRFSRMT